MTTDRHHRAARPCMLLCALLLLLGGCASLPESTLQAPLWQLQGKLSVNSSRGSGSGQIDWQLFAQRFEITLQGPLGYGAVRLSGSAEQALLERGDQTLRGSFAELSQHWLAAPVPIEALRHWADGAPAPSLPEPQALSYNSAGQLSGFSQAGWQLRFSRHQSSVANALPGKVSGQRETDRFTLIVQSRAGQP